MLRRWQNETANIARATGELRSVAGRPLKAEWEGGELRWTQCCNFPVQSSAADVMLIAMARVHAALEGRDARLILQVHDELVIEFRRGHRGRGRGDPRGAHGGRLVGAVPGRPDQRPGRRRDPAVLGEGVTALITTEPGPRRTGPR